MKLYLSIVQNDWANKSSSAPRHLTSVDKVLQFANLHGALKPSGQRCSSVHRAHSHAPFNKAAMHTLCCNPQPFCLGTSSEASKQRDLSLTIASAAVRHVQRLFCLLSLQSSCTVPDGNRSWRSNGLPQPNTWITDEALPEQGSDYKNTHSAFLPSASPSQSSSALPSD